MPFLSEGLTPDLKSRLRIGTTIRDGPGYFKVQPAGERLGDNTSTSMESSEGNSVSQEIS